MVYFGCWEALRNSAKIGCAVPAAAAPAKLRRSILVSFHVLKSKDLQEEKRQEVYVP
jgi:hypothetical protein